MEAIGQDALAGLRDTVLPPGAEREGSGQRMESPAPLAFAFHSATASGANYFCCGFLSDFESQSFCHRWYILAMQNDRKRILLSWKIILCTLNRHINPFTRELFVLRNLGEICISNSGLFNNFLKR